MTKSANREENMSIPKKLKKLFDNEAIQRIDERKKDDPSNLITVSDVYNMLAKGYNTGRIRRERPEIKTETVALARAFIIANAPDVYDRIWKKSRANDYRALVDECLPARVIPLIRENCFGWATHTNFVKLQGRPDDEVWQWAVNNGVDAVITRDWKMTDPEGDLTYIAVEHAKAVLEKMDESDEDFVDVEDLPVVIHVKTQYANYGYVAKLFNMHKDQILSYVDTRTTPYIEVTERGVKAGPTYTELWAAQKMKGESEESHEVIPRRDSWISRWMNEILAGKRDEELTQEQRQKIEAMVRAGAALCTVEASKPHPNVVPTRKPRFKLP